MSRNSRAASKRPRKTPRQAAPPAVQDPAEGVPRAMPAIPGEEQAAAPGEEDRKGAEEALAAADQQAQDLLAEAQNKADALVAEARQEAEKVCATAKGTAETEAKQEAARIRDAARQEADRILAEAAAAAGRLQEEAKQQANALKAEAEEAQRTARAALITAQQTASNLQDQAAADTDRLRQAVGREVDQRRSDADTDAAALRDAARKEADATRTAANQAASDANELLTKAQAREAAAKERELAAGRALAEAEEVLERAMSRTIQRNHRRELKDQAKADRRRARQAERADRGTLSDRVMRFVQANLRRLMVVIPITSPMAVAWTGQASFAETVLDWAFPFTILFAAAWELSTTFTGWMYHEARKQGDAGTIYRVATWCFASGAAVMNYWHNSGQVTGRSFDSASGKWVDQITYWHATPKAVSFAVVSITGMVLWELYARLIHKQYLRSKGLAARVRPKITLIRWVRYPRHSWTAWSLTITDESLVTLELAWAAAETKLAHRRSLKAVRAGLPVPSTFRVVPISPSLSPAGLPGLAVQETGLATTPYNRAATYVLERLDTQGGTSGGTKRETTAGTRRKAETGFPAPALPASETSWTETRSIGTGETGTRRRETRETSTIPGVETRRRETNGSGTRAGETTASETETIASETWTAETRRRETNGTGTSAGETTASETETTASETETIASETWTAETRRRETNGTPLSGTEGSGTSEPETDQVPAETGEDEPDGEVSSIGEIETEIDLLLTRLVQRGGRFTVKLPEAMLLTGRPKSTAAKRLAVARDRYDRRPKPSPERTPGITQGA
ncbi:vacuolar-type H+-ATPase subunit H [Kitasatospora sp. MAA19]|uniref:hypothetical protein n=1 Tax=unclassified Kitasatospora TaxID=2633591 RepID=UPI0024754755|nr:hypothetical protein [Kitasatospora sp. MAA19]MDH6710789.1 vacuolar-type H+-ATPase subunit H [Kitasatospora sp. MAA19]